MMAAMNMIVLESGVFLPAIIIRLAVRYRPFPSAKYELQKITADRCQFFYRLSFIFIEIQAVTLSISLTPALM
ncbi:hypothetical protein [Pseudochrobactrum sp. HB0163]|uniref:hypothetical protein n=1 Tax=Pseudochrobactrum sp. HB0163 TaxID=3450708 RepID=UPI003F6E21FF